MGQSVLEYVGVMIRNGQLKELSIMDSIYQIQGENDEQCGWFTKAWLSDTGSTNSQLTYLKIKRAYDQHFNDPFAIVPVIEQLNQHKIFHK